MEFQSLSPKYIAYYSDDTIAIEEGIKNKGWLITSKDETDYGENNTVVHYAAHKGSVETVKFLVCKHAFIRA